MAQDPYLVDQLDIEPGATGTRRIRNNGGALEFLDSQVTGGITLLNLAGLKTMQNVLIVGQAGAGASYTTIQSALDAIPSAASVSNPYYVLVGPGQYRESLNIVRDGVYIFGFGAVLQSEAEATPDAPTAYHTLVIQSALGTTPTRVVLRNLRITNVHANYACVRVTGGVASTVGSNGIYLIDCDLEANSAVGNHPIWANAMNVIRMQGGSMSDPNGLGLTVIRECSDVLFQSVATPTPMDFRWVATNPVPGSAHVGYFIDNAPRLGEGSSLNPITNLETSAAPNQGHLQLSGVTQSTSTPITVAVSEGTFAANGCTLGDITVTGGQGVIGNSAHGTLATAAGGTIKRPQDTGNEAFAGDTTKAVTLAAEAPDADYTVVLETDTQPTNPGPFITLKTSTGFTINFGGAETLGVRWTVLFNN